jgi:hypothetical protein
MLANRLQSATRPVGAVGAETEASKRAEAITSLVFDERR